MKLELKHLSPYLPYGLQFYIPNDEHSDIQTMTGLSKTDGIQTDYDKEDSVGCIGNLWSLDKDGRNYEFYKIKPILRPLSDLTKEIEGKCYWLLIEEIEMRYFRLKNSQIDKLCVKTYNNLLENHFDVFGLIEKDLAIDINDLKK